MSLDKERIQHIERTVVNLQEQMKQLQDDLKITIKAICELKDDFEHLKTKKWWEL